MKRHRDATELVREEFHTGHRIPGGRKIAKRLTSKGSRISHKMVAGVMKENNWRSKVTKKYKATTNSKHNLPVAENTLDRQFEASKPNQKWVSDITFVSTDEGWLYVAVILDLYGRIPVGWAMGDRINKELALDALRQAKIRRNNPKGVLLHSDQGSQYCSKAYQEELRAHGFICSMSRKGNVWDNAPMESFFGKLKQEWLNDKRFRTREEAITDIFWYIEVYYQNYRSHQTNSYMTPKEYVATGFSS